MEDNITIPRVSAETLIKMAHRVLEMTDGSSEGMERSEVAAINNRREQLKQAVYSTEKAIYDSDSKPLNVEKMSSNAERLRRWEDDFSDDKANFIEGRR
jgi:hypothetical protein